ncbi:MYLK [Branchiostoma lanceolatum]|uniref:MYLK protein n=1 Tax=Branchiostoma lanceolatum TaxID=7740 RepID=A0A8J9ZA16_BRALA|nr:MYLK [Branchiostoma lanceolatum]
METSVNGQVNGDGANNGASTTISTIVVQSGKGKIVVAVLRSLQDIQLRIADAMPGLLEVGRSLEEAKRLKKQHEDLMGKLKGKQGHVNELLHQADNVVINKEPDLDVYEAMAESLGEAWKDLNAQLEDRRLLLDAAILFHESFTDKLNMAHRLFSPLTLPQDVDTIRLQLQKHHQTKKEILEASMETMNRGQVLLDRMQDMGSHIESRHATTAACYGVEHMLENLHDRRRHMEEVWALQKLRLEKSLQLCIWKQEVNDVTAFYKSQGESYMNASNLGENAPATQILIDLHREITDKAKPMYDQVKRLLRVAESFIVGGHYDSPTIQSMAGNLHVQWETFMDRLDRRTKYLQLAFDFYQQAGEAIKKLESIDIQLSVQTRQADSTAKLAMLHASLAHEILETVSPPLRDGYILIDLIGRGKPQLAGIEQKVDELEGWKKELEERCQAHLEDAQQKGEMFLVFQERHAHVRREGGREGGRERGREGRDVPGLPGETCTCKEGGREGGGGGMDGEQCGKEREEIFLLFTWLTGVVDTFLAMHADLGTILPAALEFLSNHERLEKDMKDREPQVDIVLQAAEEFMKTGAVEAHECDVKTRDIQAHWGRVGRVVRKRISLGAIYVAFHKLARRLANEMDDLDELLKRIPTDGTKGLEIAIHRHDDQWKEVQEAFTVMERKGREFLSEVKLVRDDPQLDTERAVLCVETLLEHFGERKRMIQDQRTSWQQKLQAEEEFKQDWLRFMEEVRKTIEWIVSLEREIFPSSGADLGTNLEDAADLQDKLRKFLPTAEKTSDVVEGHVKMAEMLGVRGETGPQKESLIMLNIALAPPHRKPKTSDVVEGHVKTAEMLAARGETGPQKESLIMLNIALALPHRKPKTSDVVEGHVKTAEMLAARGETGPQKESLIMDLLRVHQRFQARLAEYILLLEMAIAFFDNINKLNMLIDKTDKDFKQMSPQSAKQVEDFLRQHEAVKKDVTKVFNHTTDSGEKIVVRVRENDGVDAARVTVEQALTMLDMRRIQWLKEWEEHRRRLEQGIKMCQLLKDIEKLRGQLSELVEQLQEFQAQLKEAKTTHTISIIMQKFEDFTSQVTAFRYRFEGLSGQVDEALKEGWDNLAPLLSQRKELRDQWQRFLQDFDTFGTRLPLAQQLFANMQEIELWLVETTKMLFELEQQARAVKTKEEAKALLPPVEQKAKEAEMQDGRVRYVSELSFRVHGKDEGEKATRHVVVQFHEVRETITYVRTEIKTKIQTLPSKHDLDMKPQIEVIKKVETPTKFELPSPPPPKKKVVPPSFAQKLTSAVVDEGSPFRFECRVEGDPTPAITWYKDNDNIASSSIYETAFINNVASLTIAEVFVEDEARYMCKASNPGGQAICSAKLTVKALETEPPPQSPVLNLNLQDIQVMEGEEITLVVKVTAYPQPDVYWFCDGQPVKESSGVRIVLQGVDTFSLVIKEAYPEDSGTYSFLAKNAHGEAHGSCRVTVERYAETTDTELMSDSEHVAPTVYETLRDRDVLEGSKIRMDCVIIGTPEPEIIWYFKDKPLKESHNKMLLFEGDKCSLVINEARYNDRGEYKCVAINPAGKAETAMTLEVEPLPATDQYLTDESKMAPKKPDIPPVFVQNFEERIYYEGAEARLTCRVQGRPAPTVTWYKDDVQVTWYKDDVQVVPTGHIRIVQIGDTHSVMFKHVGEEDYGIYMCVAANRAGSVSRCGHVSLKA